MKHDLHGELFKGEGAMDLGLVNVGDEVAFTVVVDGGVSGSRTRLPRPVAIEAWHYLGELLGARAVIEERARDLAREWIRMDDQAYAELNRLREELAAINGTPSA